MNQFLIDNNRFDHKSVPKIEIKRNQQKRQHDILVLRLLKNAPINGNARIAAVFLFVRRLDQIQCFFIGQAAVHQRVALQLVFCGCKQIIRMEKKYLLYFPLKFNPQNIPNFQQHYLTKWMVSASQFAEICKI